MKRFIASLLFAASITPYAWAQDANPPSVPVEKAPYHVPVFANEYVSLLNVQIPPNRTSGYHRHAHDSVGILLGDAERISQPVGGKPAVAARRQRGSVGFTFYAGKPATHIVTNTGSTTFHNIVIQILYPTPGRFTAGNRSDAKGYAQVLDNPRVRGWRLILEPGQSAPAITQSAPGIRIVVDGGEIIESLSGEADRGMAPRSGEFYWQDAGATRAIRNNGMTRIEFLEFEFK